MLVQDLDSTRPEWTDELSAFLPPNGAEYFLPHFSDRPPPVIPVRQPGQILLVSGSTMDELCAIAPFELPSYWEIPLDELLAARSPEKLGRERNYNRILDAFLAFHSTLPKGGLVYRKLRAISTIVEPDTPTIVLCPEAICHEAFHIQRRQMSDIPLEVVERLTVSVIVRHEVAHVSFCPPEINDLRLLEGFANRFAFDVSNQLERRLLNELVCRQGVEYNYYLLMPFLPNLRDIFAAALEGEAQASLRHFYDGVRKGTVQTAAECTGGTITIAAGFINGFIGFGSRNFKLFFTRAACLANIRRSIVCAGSIDRIVGAIDRSSVVFVNDIREADHYGTFPPNIQIVPRSQLDISDMLSSGKGASKLLKVVHSNFPQLIGIEAVE